MVGRFTFVIKLATFLLGWYTVLMAGNSAAGPPRDASMPATLSGRRRSRSLTPPWMTSNN